MAKGFLFGITEVGVTKMVISQKAFKLLRQTILRYKLVPGEVYSYILKYARRKGKKFLSESFVRKRLKEYIDAKEY